MIIAFCLFYQVSFAVTMKIGLSTRWHKYDDVFILI
jgi:hypothetical protein